MDEKDETSSKNKQIGLGIIGFAAILFVLLTFVTGLYHPNDLGLFSMILFTSFLVCVGFLFLFLGSSHDEIGTYLIFMGLALILFGIIFILLLNVLWMILSLLYFFPLGFPFGYLSGPICILLGIYKKKKKDRYQTGILSTVGLVLFSISFMGLTLFLDIIAFTVH